MLTEALNLWPSVGKNVSTKLTFILFTEIIQKIEKKTRKEMMTGKTQDLIKYRVRS